MVDINFDDHFKDLFENTNDLIHLVTLEGKIKLVNPAWLKTLNYEFYEVEGRNIYDFIHDPCIKEYREVRSFAIKNNSVVELVTTLVTKHGDLIVGEGQIGCSYNKDGLGYTRGVFKNITARKTAEKKIEESEKRLKTFFQSGPDAVIVINENQEILEWNPKAEIIFGFTAMEVIGKPLSDTIIPPQYREAHVKGMFHFLKTGEGPVLNKTIEITALHKKGHEFYINLSVSSVKLGNEWLFIAFLSDISERKKTEEALIRKEAELLQAKLLEEKKDEFISIASHELKTPLTTIKAYAQLALTVSKDEEQKPIQQFLLKIDQYAAKLNFLLNELLDVSRIHAGKLRLTQTEVELNSFLPEVLKSVQHITQDHKIILEKNESAKIKVDSLRLEQVITNIISNAAKYSPGKDRIIINTFKSNGSIVVSFTDFGIGIPQEKIHKIFDRFYRVDEVSKDFSGLGIGLFISSEIIKQHGGKIWAENNDGEGSTIYFTLPAAN
jgi:PAS domain S-box-containing protein